MKNTVYILGIFAALLTSGCTQQDGVENSHKEEAHAHEEEATKEEVHLVRKQMDVMGIELGKFQFLNLSTTVKSNGHLELPPQNKASLSAVLGGRVKSITVLEGDYVTKGQTLATLEHPDFVDIQEQYMIARSQLVVTEKNYERKKVLNADSISSTKSFEEAEAEYLSALTSVNALKAKLQILDIDLATVEEGNFISAVPVRSPIKGYVKLIQVNMAKYVQPQQEMFEIVDNEHIHIDLMVYEKDVGLIVNGQQVIFSLSSSPDSVFQGSIFAVGKSFEEEPKAMLVHAEIENKKGNLLPGMYVDARIITDKRNVRVLPNDAIVSDGGLNYIFALKPSAKKAHSHEQGTTHEHKPKSKHEHEGKDSHENEHAQSKNDKHGDEFVFQKIEVNVGTSDIGFSEVTPARKLAANVKIVTKGAFYLLAELNKGEGGHGHHH